MEMLDLAIKIALLVNAVAIPIGGWIVASVRRTVDKLQRFDEETVKRLTKVEVDTATLMEWRRGHEDRHNELLVEIRDLKKAVLRLLAETRFHDATD